VKAEDLLTRQAALESQRYNFEAIWQRVADLIYTGEAMFQIKRVEQGQRLDRQQFDSTGALALDRFAAAMESMITPRTQRWATLVPSEKALADDIQIKRYLESVNDTLFRYRYAAAAGFTTATGESYRSLGAFGSQVLFIEDDLKRGGMRYRSRFLGEMWFDVNAQGMVDINHRKFEFTARQAYQAFGDGPRDIYRKTMEKNPGAKMEFLHCVSPDQDYTGGGSKRFPWKSCYVDKSLQVIVEEGGYFTNPYVASRFSTSPQEVYGRGPAITVLNALNTVNEQQKTIYRAGQMATRPPLMAVDDDELRGFNMREGAINYGALDEQGNQRVKPFISGANLPIGLEMIESEREVINQAFYVTLFQILIDSPQMTATEALLRAQEKGALLAPPMGRQQTEMVGPMIEREIDILSRQGRLPPPPPQLVEAGGILEIEYTAPVNRLQKSEEGVAILRTLESLAPVAQVDPTVYDPFNFTEMARTLADVNGVPAKCLRTDEEIAEIKQGQQDQAALGEVLAAAPVAGKVAADLSKLQQTSMNNVAGVL
jgi:hypothetical protein